MTNLRAVLIVTVAILLPLSAFAAWETVGGNSLRNGRASFEGPQGPTTRWSLNDNCLFAGQIYIDGDIGATMRFNTINYSPILAFDVTTGTELWTLDLPGASTRSLPVGFRDGQLYALGFQETNHDTLYALDPADGSVLWIADVGIKQGIIASAAFAPNGDLIVNGKDPGGSYLLTRIDHTDGSVVWSTPRVLAVVGGSEHVAVHAGKVYGWKGGLGQVEFTAWDLETGAELYGISLPGDGDQEIPFTVASEDAIYIIRDGGDLFRLQDDGTQFIQRWNVPVDFGTIPPVGGHFGVLANGDVIVPHGTVLKRHAFGSGAVLAESDPLTGGGYLGYPRFAIDDNDVVYCGTSTSDGQLIALDPVDLSELWSANVTNIHYSGPAVGANGDVLVAGNGGVLCFEGVSGEEPALVTVEVEPFGGGIPEVPRGFALQYWASLTTGAVPGTVNGHVWTEATLPNGSVFGPVFVQPVAFVADMDVTVPLQQLIPNFAPLGMYEWHLNAGFYPGYVAATDSFPFEVIPAGEIDSALGDPSASMPPVFIPGETYPSQTGAEGLAGDVDPRYEYRGQGMDHWTTDQPVPAALVSALSGREDGTQIASAEPVPTKSDIDLQIYPNPANAMTTVTISVTEPQHVTLAVTDILGREVMAVDAGVVHPGGMRVPLSFDGWASGTYLVSITGHHGLTTTQRVTVMK